MCSKVINHVEKSAPRFQMCIFILGENADLIRFIQFNRPSSQCFRCWQERLIHFRFFLRACKCEIEAKVLATRVMMR